MHEHEIYCGTDLDVDVHLLLLVAVDHGPVLDDEPVLGALEVDGHLLDRGDHDDKGVALMLALTLSDTGTGHGCLHNWPRWLTLLRLWMGKLPASLRALTAADYRLLRKNQLWAGPV